jgi:TetR/AcrR family transcriptional repressor of nem operon
MAEVTLGRPREFSVDAALERAMEVFWTKGYEATSIADLVEATGVQRGSLYAAFGSKHQLYLAALDRYEAERSAPLGGLLAEVDRHPRPVREVIGDLLFAVVDQGADDTGRRGCMMVNAAAERGGCDREVAERARRAAHTATEVFAALVRRAQARGEVTDGLDPVAAGRLFTVLVQGLRIVARTDPDRTGLRRAVEAALTVLDTGTPAQRY